MRAEDGASNLGPYSNVVTVTTLATIPELVAAYAFDERNWNDGERSVRQWPHRGDRQRRVGLQREKIGRALQFNGTNAKVSVPDAASLQLTTGMTLEAWVNPSVVTSAWRDVIYKDDDNYFLEATSPDAGRPGAGGTFGANVLYGTAALPVNTWTHLAVTYDRVTLRLYVNGVQVSSVAATGAIATSTNPLTIGATRTYGQYFQGMIDEVRIYNRALAQAEIQTDMNHAHRRRDSSGPDVSRSSIDFGSVSDRHDQRCPEHHRDECVCRRRYGSGVTGCRPAPPTSDKAIHAAHLSRLAGRARFSATFTPQCDRHAHRTATFLITPLARRTRWLWQERAPISEFPSTRARC